jgi:hypothetical protein
VLPKKKKVFMKTQRLFMKTQWESVVFDPRALHPPPSQLSEAEAAFMAAAKSRATPNSKPEASFPERAALKLTS